MFLHTTILPCTCSVLPLFWSYRYEAFPLFHSLHHRRDKSHSAGRHLPGWPEGVTCPARTHRAILKNTSHVQRTDRSSKCRGLHLWTDVSCCLTWEDLSSSAACEEVERVSSDWPRDPTLPLTFSNLPLPLLCGGDESESLATAPSSSKVLQFLITTHFTLTSK